ncbi:MAG: hypothetical protein AB7H77_03900 [Bdellovibrionales bacterium]
MSNEFLKKGAERFNASLEKIFAGLEKSAKGALESMAPASKTEGAEESKRERLAKLSGNISSLSKVLTSAPGLMGDYYFPSELIGGCCPRVVGSEEDIVWNAAAEACDSERVHVVWQAIENRIWYVAVRSAELAAHPNTWCPFASLLPGMKDSQPSPVCYTYYSDEAATMMTVTQDGLQIHRGMSSVVRAKAERTARDLGNAPVIELVPERILKLTPSPWYSISLFEDRARRILATFAVLTALSLTGLAFVVWLMTTMVVLTAKANLEKANERAELKTTELMRTAVELRASPMRDQLAAFANVNDGLLAVNGFLEIYEIKDGKTRWRALVPANVTADRINDIGGKTIETSADGVAIGNAAQIDFEAAKRGMK